MTSLCQGLRHTIGSRGEDPDNQVVSNVECRSSQLARKALSLKVGCLKFDHYLSGNLGFAVITDHKLLLGLYCLGARPPPRIECWALHIQHLNFHMRYKLELKMQQTCYRNSQYLQVEPSTQASWWILGLSMPSYLLHYLILVLWKRSAQLQPVIQSCKLLSKALHPIVGITLSLPLSMPTY